MEKWIGNLLIDLFPPERAKFKLPLILVHGLWTSSRCWRAWATHFSNLGWECWAVNFRGRFEESATQVLKRLSFEDCVDDLRQAIRAAGSPPALLAHDLGGLIALKAAEEEKLSALILVATVPPGDVAPELPRAIRLLRLKYSPLLFLRRPFRVEEKDFRKHWLGALPESRHAEAFGCLVADSSRLIAEFFTRGVRLDPKSIRCPVLVVAGREDRVVDVSALRKLSEQLGADFLEYAEGSHWIIGEEDGEGIVRDIHRWIVRKSSEEILLADLSEHP